MSSEKEIANNEASNVDLYNQHMCSNLNSFSSKKKTLKCKIYENRLNYGKLSKIGLVLDEVKYLPYFQNNIQDLVSNDTFYKKAENINLSKTFVYNNKDINFSVAIRSHRRKSKLQSMLELKMNDLDKINKEIQENEKQININKS